jgi:hypothetical protein
MLRIHHLYVDETGETHFKDLLVEYETIHFDGADHRAKPIPVRELIFRQTIADQDLDFHNAPQRQFCINLDAGVEVTVSDGETRYVGPGEVLLLEDVTGKGHMSRHIEKKLRQSVFITLA